MLATAPGAGVVAVAVSDPRVPLNDQEPVNAGLYARSRPYWPGATSPIPPPRKTKGKVSPFWVADTVVGGPAGSTLIAPKKSWSPVRNTTVLELLISLQALAASIVKLNAGLGPNSDGPDQKNCCNQAMHMKGADERNRLPFRRDDCAVKDSRDHHRSLLDRAGSSDAHSS